MENYHQVIQKEERKDLEWQQLAEGDRNEQQSISWQVDLNHSQPHRMSWWGTLNNSLKHLDYFEEWGFQTQRCKYKKFSFFTSVSCLQLPRLEGTSCMLYTTIECIQKSATFMLYIALERPIRWYWFIQKATIKTLFLLELNAMLVLCSPCIIELEPLQSCENCSPIITQIQLLQQW